MRRLRLVSSSILAAGILLGAACPRTAAQDAPKRKSAKARKAWKAALKVEAKAHYDTNTFLLSDGQKTRLQAALPDDQISGRFTDMNSVSDYVFTPGAKLLVEGPGMGGRKMGFEAGVFYDRYFLNPRRSHVKIDLGAEQSTSRNGRARVRFEYTPSYFYRNYLADATNFSTSVMASERVYKADVYSQWDLTADYRHRLPGGKAALLARAGYLQRRNQTPAGTVTTFEGRNRNTPHFGGGLDFGPTKWWKVDGNYDYAMVDSPRVQEVLILNEPDFGVDFNNDGSATDLRIRTVQYVNRSHREHLLRATTKLGVREKSYVEFGFERRHRNFLSKEPFDVVNNGRTDNRNTFHLAFVSHLTENFELNTGYSYMYENSNRPNDPGVVGEINDYKRGVVFAGLSFRF